MIRTGTILAAVLSVAGHTLALGAAPAPSQAAAHEKRGKQIYLRGINAAGKEITARLGNPPMEVPGSLMACANCHGYDGRGKPEGGVVPADITWPALTKPYGVTHESGRKHPPYNEILIERAIRAGADPAGNRLNPAMPRYELSREDMLDLIAYLKRLGNDPDPGLTEDTITIGTLVPTQGRLAEAGEEIRAVLAGYFSEINERGGIYSRRIQLRVAPCGQSVAETKEQARRLIEDENVFAMAGAFIAGADKEIASLLEDKEVPLVGPAALYPHAGYPLNRQVFYLFSGVKEESRALVSFAAETMEAGTARPAVVFPEGEFNSEIVAALEEQCRKAGWDKLTKLPYKPDEFKAGLAAQQLRDGGTNVVLLLGSGREELALTEEAGRLGWKPVILAPVSLAGRDVFETPSSFQGRIYLAFPIRTSDQSPGAVMEFRAFAARHKIAGGNLAAGISAYSAATVLVEGLKKAGRDVSREKLIAALEGIYKYNTGLTPPLTYGPNRRIGALGAHVVEVLPGRKELAAGGKWIELQ